MYLLIFLSTIIILFVIIIDKRAKYNPIFLFVGVWLLVFILYNINLINLNDVEDRTIAILAVMIISFSAGGVLGIANRKKISFRISLNRKREKVVNYYLREKMFFVLCTIAAVVMFIDQFSIIISVLSGNSFHTIIREASGLQTVEISGAAQVFIYIFIVQPISFLVSPVCAVNVFGNPQKRKIYLMINILLVTLSVMHHGGRNAIFQMAICYGLIFLIYEKDAVLNKRTKFLMIVAVLLFVALVNNISESRGIENVYESFYAYFTCSIPLMQQHLKSGLISNTFLCGFFSLNGFFYPLMLILNYTGFSSPKLYLLTQEFRFYIEESFLSIGEYSHGMNNFMPAGGFLYIDGGYLFEIIGMAIYGFVCGCIYKKIRKQEKRDDRSLVIYTLLSVGLVLSFCRFWFTSSGYAIAFLYLFILFGKEKRNYI